MVGERIGKKLRVVFAFVLTLIFIATPISPSTATEFTQVNLRLTTSNGWSTDYVSVELHLSDGTTLSGTTDSSGLATFQVQQGLTFQTFATPGSTTLVNRTWGPGVRTKGEGAIYSASGASINVSIALSNGTSVRTSGVVNGQRTILRVFDPEGNEVASNSIDANGNTRVTGLWLNTGYKYFFDTLNSDFGYAATWIGGHTFEEATAQVASGQTLVSPARIAGASISGVVYSDQPEYSGSYFVDVNLYIANGRLLRTLHPQDNTFTYSFNRLPPGDYYVSAQDDLNRNQKIFHSGKLGIQDATRITLATGQNVSNVNFQLLPSLVLTPNPSVSGSMVAGSTLTAVPGVWDSGVGFSYQWLSDGSPISGETGSTFVVPASLVGHVVTVSVTGSKSGFVSAVRTSTNTGQVYGQGFLLSPTPKIVGTAAVGKSLTVSSGTWKPAPTSIQYQWLRNGEVIPGATRSSYLLTVQDVSHSISVKIVGSKSQYAPTEKRSTPTVEIPRLQFSKSPIPIIVGSNTTGALLSVSLGSWSPTPSVTYQWRADGVPIEAAVGPTLSVTNDYLGKAITVALTATQTGYVTKNLLSLPTQRIALPPIPAQGNPTIYVVGGGTPRVAGTLSANTGNWTLGTQFQFTWFKNNQLIVGESGSSYILRPGDLSGKIHVRVDSSLDGFVSSSKLSSQTSPVASGLFSSTPSPTLIGSLTVGSTLSLEMPAWTPQVDAATFVWKRDSTVIKGAGRSTYTLVAADKGKKISVTVTGSKAGYTSVAKSVVSSAKITSPVQLSQFSALSKPYARIFHR